MKPKISIIVPVYNVSDYIERCINSIILQTYKGEIECIIVNDATTDDSIEKCKRIINAYKGAVSFKIIEHEKNKGLSAARNTGTKTSTGEYLFYVDSDDDISSDCIESLVEYVINDNTVELVQGNYAKISNNCSELGKSEFVRAESNDELRELFLSKRTLNEFVWNKIIKRSIIIDNNLYNKEGLINEDLLWAFYLIKHIKKAQLCGNTTYYYRVRPGSIVTSGSNRRQGSSYAYIYEEILHNLTSGKELNEMKGFLYNFAYNYALYVRSTPELKSVMQLYKQRVKTFRYYYGWIVLTLISSICKIINLPPILERLNRIRVKKIALN